MISGLDVKNSERCRNLDFIVGNIFKTLPNTQKLLSLCGNCEGYLATLTEDSTTLKLREEVNSRPLELAGARRVGLRVVGI